MPSRRHARRHEAQSAPMPIRRRFRTRRVLASVAALAITSGLGLVGASASPAAAAPAVAITSSSRAQLAEAQLLWQINATRARRGLAPLASHPVLADQTQAWSTWMAAHGSLFHHPDLASMAWLAQPSGWSAVAENLGYGTDGLRLHDQFMASRTHAANVLGNFRSVGVGAVESGGRVWVTVRFLR